MTNLSVVELENMSLRARLAELKTAALKAADTVDRYVRQECLRSELLNTNAALRLCAEGKARKTQKL